MCWWFAIIKELTHGKHYAKGYVFGNTKEEAIQNLHDEYDEKMNGFKIAILKQIKVVQVRSWKI